MLKSGTRVSFDVPDISAYIYYVRNSITRNKDPKKNEIILHDHLNLRFRIREYLKDVGCWNVDMDIIFNDVLYSLLMDKYLQIPEVVNKKYHELKLKIPIKKRVKQRTTMFIKRIISVLS